MSYASEARHEVAHILPQSECCAISEITCALLMTGGISFQGRGKYAVSLLSSDAAVARHYFRILRDYFAFCGEMVSSRSSAFGGSTQYRLQIPQENVNGLLDKLGLLDPSSLFGIRSLPRDDAFVYSCCKRSFLRSAFLCGGSVTSPEKSHQFEFVCPNEEFAFFVNSLLIYFDIYAKISVRRSRHIVYIKQKDAITDTLRLIGAASSTMAYENVLITKELSNRVNRQLNCDGSNIERSTVSAMRQLQDIALIEEQVGLEKLPETLRSYALARKANPSLSLTLLGEEMVPSVSKSGIAARARRVSQIADQLRSGEETELE